MDYPVVRELNLLYIFLDIGFLVIFGYLLWNFKKKMAFIFGVAGALLYFLVDYGIFYLLLGTREVVGADTFWFLLWLSTSYGFTNFVWIWLLLSKDKRIIEWSIFIVIGWITVALIAQSFGSGFQQISISRGTVGYHGYMAMILFAGYLYVVIRNLKSDDEERIPILKLILYGIMVQFAWEAVLLITGIRPLAWNSLVINSLLETNLGLPYLYFIHKALKSRFNEDATAIETNLSEQAS